jgi:hypothetical protein
MSLVYTCSGGEISTNNYMGIILHIIISIPLLLGCIALRQTDSTMHKLYIPKTF